MAVATQTAPTKLLTAEEFCDLPDDGRHTELVRGVIVEMPPPKTNHGYYCTNVSGTLREFVRANDLGRVVSNDSGVVTERGPDTVRGMDAAFYSFDRVPRGPLPDGYWPAPDVVFEVRSPSDRWKALTAKAAEYLTAGVRLVAILDPGPGTLTVFEEDTAPRTLAGDDEFTAPAVLPGFAVPVRRFLE